MNTQQIVIKTLRKFEVSDDQKSFGIFIFTVFALLLFCLASVFMYRYSLWFALLFWIPIGIMLCRCFVLEHDCGHGSFFTKRKYNRYAGLVLGFFTMIPNRLWNHIHDVHHGAVGNLSARKKNPELWTMTVKEYQASSILKKIGYRIMRSMFMRLIVTPAMWMIVPRIPLPHLGLKIFISTILHTIIYGVIFYFLVVNNLLLAFTLIYLIPVYLFNFLASIFFYLQHQYDETYWEQEENWDLYQASIYGSSYLVVGKILAWISGNVGCHHIHHLNTKIPSYSLHMATHEANQHLSIQPIYMNELLHHLNCVLWDENQKKLISFKELRIRE